VHACLAVILLAGANPAASNPRDVVERYVSLALAGQVDAAAGLAVDGQSPGRPERIKEFRTFVRAVRFPTVWADEGRAIAVSDVVELPKARPDGSTRGHLVFALVKTGDAWLVKDIDFRSGEEAKDRVEKFKKRPGAAELPEKPRK
jgi:hypothetical protein